MEHGPLCTADLLLHPFSSSTCRRVCSGRKISREMLLVIHLISVLPSTLFKRYFCFMKINKNNSRRSEKKKKNKGNRTLKVAYLLQIKEAAYQQKNLNFLQLLNFFLSLECSSENKNILFIFSSLVCFLFKHKECLYYL